MPPQHGHHSLHGSEAEVVLKFAEDQRNGQGEQATCVHQLTVNDQGEELAKQALCTQMQED